ncbi:MAG TPA: hypothetical protein VNO53_00245 [Steroidobacteraceae bacterium]|nr:hypothetical protein [Steroidobacteraceae bacterium]
MLQSISMARVAAVGRGRVASILLGLVLSGCDDSTRISVPAPSDFTIAGEVSGLAAGQSVVLNSGSDALTITDNGAFAFPSPVNANGSYSVIVATQPTGSTCTVTDGSGAGVTQDVSDVSVVCSPYSYAIAGSLSGLAGGAEVTLRNNGADDLTIPANGSFTFATPVAYDGSYAVTVAVQPAGATCTVSNATGSGVTADVSDVDVSCSTHTYVIGGTVTGLGDGLQVTLFNNAADPLTVSANGAFTFEEQVADQGSYDVTVGTQPVSQTCTVMNGQGANLTSNVADVSVVCSIDTFTIGGTLSGLGVSAQVTLENNGADPLTLTSNGPFTFDTPVVSEGAYAVTVGTQPGGQICAVSDGAGTNVTADVVDVTVQCIESSVSFTTPGSYIYTVPAGVTSIQVAAVGGGGGGGGLSGVGLGQPGGAGAVVVSTLSVTAGQSLNLVVGGGGGDGADGPADGGGGYTCGAGGGGGGSSNIDAGTPTQIIAGGGGGGGSCNSATAGGSGSQNNDGAGGSGGASFMATGGGGGDAGLGGAGGTSMFFPGMQQDGADGEGGAGGIGDDNSPAYPGGQGGTSVGAGTGGNATLSLAGGGGGGHGGGGAGTFATGGGAGGSTGPAGSSFAPGTNGGASTTPGGDGSIVITLME